MENRNQLQPAYVLFSRPFQNTSVLLDLFTIDHGRIRAVAKGARRQSSKYRSLLQPFNPLLIAYTGKGEVKTLGNVESSVAPLSLKGERLFSGIYLNEILCRLLHTYAEHKPLFNIYEETLIALQGSGNLEAILRVFELNLLSELGYAINFYEVFSTQEPIVEEGLYKFSPDLGFELISKQDCEDDPHCLFEGGILISIRRREMADREVAKSAKRLLRIALASLLGGKPLKSREIFASL